MNIGHFDDKKHLPNEIEISAAIGTMLDEWQALSEWICTNYTARDEFKFMYGQKYGWGRKFQVGGSLLACLYPTHNGFTGQVILNNAALAKAAQLKLRKSAQQAIAKATPYPEGKWLFIPITCRGDRLDFQQLLAFKRQPGVKAKKAVATA
jgi:Protein of unknown function (DUF3788)